MRSKVSPEYRAWSAARLRCHNPKDKQYKNYGGRGITMSKKWRRGFKYFIKDMGNRPSIKHELDRKNNDRGYYKRNCRWVTKSINLKNRRY